MDNHTTAETPASAEAPAAEDIALIRQQTRETLELLRALVAALLNKPEKSGPTLEDLIAALVAQQRDALILLRQIALDQAAILDRMPMPPGSGEGTAENGHAAGNGAHRP